MHKELFNNCINVLYICGRQVQNYVQKNWINLQSYTHYTQSHIYTAFSVFLYPVFYPQITHGLHKKSMQLISVNNRLYTLYTGPITTTTLNIYKKGM